VTNTFSAVDVIRHKRDGAELSAAEISWVLQAYTRGDVAEEQMAALAMAVYFNGMGPQELTNWTTSMVDSGKRMDFSSVPRPTVDKHSTGGVGDKITLPLVPIVAACGAAVPQLSGRGLGHTGGTLDKLEAIPGWRAHLSNDEILAVPTAVGGVICAAGEDLAPADRKLYALRDVTSTVESIPLIASSIMSKKIAEGTSALVLDVKTGAGAFMSDPERALELATTMVALGRDAGLRTRAVVTAMDVPLGRAVGNALEVAESVEVLAGGGPADVVELTLVLARHMLELVGIDADPHVAIRSGAAMDSWREMIRAQGGDPDAVLPSARHIDTIRADRDGMVTRCDALAIGRASWRLGAGRQRKEDPVSPTAGIEVLVKPGDLVRQGQGILRLHADDAVQLDSVADFLQAHQSAPITIGAETEIINRLPLVMETVEG
jgi:thymidine phosphorylase